METNLIESSIKNRQSINDLIYSLVLIMRLISQKEPECVNGYIKAQNDYLKTPVCKTNKKHKFDELTLYYRRDMSAKYQILEKIYADS